MHQMDSKIKPDTGVPEGRVVIHPHSREAYVFSHGKWQLASEHRDEKRLVEDAYDRAMRGI